MNEGTISITFFILLLRQFLLLPLQKLSHLSNIRRTNDLLENLKRKINRRSRPLHEIPSHDIDLLFSAFFNDLVANLLKFVWIGNDLMEISELLMNVSFL